MFACISPWNFPLAIFTGQIAAALGAGNAVIAKPAEQTPLIAAARRAAAARGGRAGGRRCICCRATGATSARALVGRPARRRRRLHRLDRHGAAPSTGRLAARDGAIVPLIAETGGLNAMIVDSSALPEQVVRRRA